MSDPSGQGELREEAREALAVDQAMRPTAAQDRAIDITLALLRERGGQEDLRGPLADAFRDFIHGQSFSLCNRGVDTCPDWHLAWELVDVAMAVIGERGGQPPAEPSTDLVLTIERVLAACLWKRALGDEDAPTVTGMAQQIAEAVDRPSTELTAEEAEAARLAMEDEVVPIQMADAYESALAKLRSLASEGPASAATRKGGEDG